MVDIKLFIIISFIPQKDFIFRSKHISLQLSGLIIIAKGMIGDGQSDIQENESSKSLMLITFSGRHLPGSKQVVWGQKVHFHSYFVGFGLSSFVFSF